MGREREGGLQEGRGEVCTSITHACRRQGHIQRWPFLSTHFPQLTFLATLKLYECLRDITLCSLLKDCRGGAWVGQLVKHLTLDLSSGHDLTVLEFKLHIELCTGGTETAWDSLSPSLSVPLPDSHTLSFSK